MAAGPLVVAFKLIGAHRAIVAETLDAAAEVVYLSDLDDAAREAALRGAGAVLLWNTTELKSHELALMAGAKLLQTMTAGVDFLQFSALPEGLPVASNGGAYAEPMAEHALAMALAAAKRLLTEHTALATGAFNQFVPNKMLAGGVCGIFGFGGIGVATAKLMRGIGMQVHAINRRGSTDAEVDWIGGTDQLDTLLAASDVLVISAPLSRLTRGIIDAAALARDRSRTADPLSTWRAARSLMKPAAVCAFASTPAFHRLHRRLVDRTGAAWALRDGPAVPDAAERDRFTTQLGLGVGLARCRAAAGGGELPPRTAGRGAAVSGAGRGEAGVA